MSKKLTAQASLSLQKSQYPLAQELPYWDFSDDICVLIDGSLVAGIELRGISIETSSNDEINRVCSDLRALLNSIPDGTELTINASRRRYKESVLDDHRDQCGTNSDVSWITEVRRQWIKADIENESILAPVIHLYLYKRIETSSGKRLGFFSPPARFISQKKREYESAAKSLLQSLESISASLDAIGMGCKKLSGLEIQEEIYTFLNPSRAKTIATPKVSTAYRQQEFSAQEVVQAPQLSIPSAREQLAFSDLFCQPDALKYDGLFHRCITLKTLPEYTHASLIASLTSLSFPHMVSVHIKVPEQSKELARLQTKRRIAHSLSISHDGRPNDLENEAKLSSTEDLLRDLISSGQKLFYFQCTVYISAENRELLEQRTRTILLKFRELNGAEGMAETVATLKVWKSILPMGNLSLPRSKRVKTDNLADFIPLYRNFTGIHKCEPICLFQSRNDTLVPYDPFNSSLPNFNTLITGSSGAGKSFIANQVLIQYLTRDPLLFIVDIGGSYRKLCEFSKGEYVELSFNSTSPNYAINPFQLSEGEKVPPARKIKFLVSMLETIFSDEEKGTIPKLHRSLLEEQIMALYDAAEVNDPPTLSCLRKRLMESENLALKDYASMLFTWTGNRPFGRLFDVKKGGLNSKRNTVVFDLKGLSAYPDLQAVMLLILTDFILGRIDDSPSERKLLVMDECWKLLKSAASKDFMEYCVRTMRKTASGITFVTQGLEEIVASPIGAAILSSTATKLVLSQKGDLTTAQHLLKLNDRQMELISSLRQKKGHYSEALLLANEERAVIRIQPTPLEYWLATSDPADGIVYNSFRADHPEKTITETIFELAKMYPNGTAGGKV